MTAKLPCTVDEAVDCLLFSMHLEAQLVFGALPNPASAAAHLDLGRWVSTNMGLTQGNEGLLADTGALDAVGATAVIMAAFWLALRRQHTVKVMCRPATNPR